MSYRNDVDALAARHDALAAEVAGKSRELAEAARLLDDARARARLPVLDNIRVAAPCRADWNAMTGDDRVRHCGSCDKRVYNLSDLTRDEAEALIVAHEGKLCVRYFRRHDGTILTRDCRVGISRRRRLRVIAAGAAALLGASAYLAWTGGRGDERPRELEVMGGIEPLPPPPPVEEVKGELVEPPPQPPTQAPPHHVEVLGGVSLDR